MENEQQQSQQSLHPQSSMWADNRLSAEIKLTHIQDEHYFLLINKKHQKALSFPSSTSSQYAFASAQLLQPDQSDINQIFQIQQILPERFEIVHSMSTLVLNADQNQCKLSFGKWKSTQFFFPKKLPSSGFLEYWIKATSSPKDKKYLIWKDGKLKFVSLMPSSMLESLFLQKSQSKSNQSSQLEEHLEAVWEIRLCSSNKQLNRTCWFEYAFSNKVIDIPQASDKPGISFIQYHCNYRFNQRFNIRPFSNKKSHFGKQTSENSQSNFFTIESLKTMQLITLEESAFSSTVVQRPPTGKDTQLWSIEYVGSGLYKIRSVVNSKMFLVVRERSFKECETIEVCEREDWCLWKIVGNFNLMPNKDHRF